MLISYHSSIQWCNLTLARWFWTTKVCLQASKISKICQFGHANGQVTFSKANFENYSRYSLIKWYQFLSILYNLSNTSFSFRHTFLLSARSSQSHATSCSSFMSHHWDNNKCNRVKGQHWRWLIYALCNFLLHMLHVFRINHHHSWKFHKFYRKTPVL